ncbi:hypothetical protein C5167_021269 [Papaver somniferum]|uniref:3-hydroxyacyl-CoA dehydrogenase C-terminal domain-containing protein n=1 Tax=Papaver somniferum TaxID=3469 RepID=A0A4Y7IYN4_PAPSO|nr:hypothetical protein C5167_021269 [Papaver somniferum]
MTVGKAIKKVSVTVENCTVFEVNRTFFPYGQGAHIFVHLSVDLLRIDRLVREFGISIGPFQLQDIAGYGIGIATVKLLASAFRD